LQVKAFSVKYLPEPKNGWIIPLTIDVDLAEDSTIIAELGRVAKKVGPEFEISTPELEPVKVEWQGTGLNPSEEPTLFSGPVVLHLHGGGYISGSAATERTATLRLAELSRSRVLSVDYRLSPKYIFPAALLDAIIAYKFLVQPPQGATHSAVDPGKLIIAGDSAGVPSRQLQEITFEGRSCDCLDDLFSEFRIVTEASGCSIHLSPSRRHGFLSPYCRQRSWTRLAYQSSHESIQ
jgi:alpha/beta hydrolase fold